MRLGRLVGNMRPRVKPSIAMPPTNTGGFNPGRDRTIS
jgi:hypothetical protein